MVKTQYILNKKRRRSIKENRKQFLAIIAISFLAVALYTGLIANAKYLEKRVNMLYDSGNMGDVFLTVNDYQDADYQYIKNLDDTLDISKRATIEGFSNENNIKLMINEVGNRISVPIIYDGKNDRRTGIIVDKNFMEKNNLNLNENLNYKFHNYFLTIIQNSSQSETFKSILTDNVKEGKENILLNETLELNFVINGTMMHPEAVENSDFTSGLAYTTYDYFISVLMDSIKDNYNLDDENLETINLLIKNNYDYNNIEQLIKAKITTQIVIKTNNETGLAEKIDSYFLAKEKNNLIMNLTKETLPSNVAIQGDITQAIKLTYVFPVIFFIVSVLVILTTLSQMIVRERMQIGTLKAIGVSRRQILWHYTSYGAFLCLIGSILGIIVGPILIPLVMNVKYELLWELPNASIPLFHIQDLICILLLMFMSIVVSYIVCKKEVDLKPIESMRPKAPKQMKAKLVSSKKGGKTSIASKMAIRNIFINIPRSLMVIIGVMGCTALVTCGFGIDDTLNYGVKLDLYELYPYDVSLVYVTGAMSPKDNIENISGVEKVEDIINYPIKLSGKKTIESEIRLLEEGSIIYDHHYEGSGVILTKNVAEEIGVSTGDTIQMIINGKKYERVVDEIHDSCFTKGVIDLASNYDDLELSPNMSWVKTKDDADNNYVRDEALKVEGVYSAQTSKDVNDYADTLLSNIRLMTATIKVFAILLAFVVVYNLATLNVRERTRDIATMKVLGFNRKEVASTLILEIMLLTVLGAIIGLIFGYPLMVLIMSINKTNLMTYIYHIYPISFVYAFLISAGTGLLINFVLSKRAYKIKMVESLKSIE